MTRTFLPPREEYDSWLDRIYASHTLTNNGPIHQELEETLRDRFGVPHMLLMSNGTIAIQLAIRALGIKGSIITTPYSYVATTSAILWEGCEPIFVDIDPQTFCIDPTRIEAAITSETKAILATHVYGFPCDVEAIERIALKHGLKVIYDAAHAFDIEYKGRSILQWGDASTLSFHATKLFHTVEGGAVVTNDPETLKQLRLLRSFGHIGDDHFSLGVNGKMSEMHAAMGMAVLPHMPAIIQSRKHITERYVHGLAGTALVLPKIPNGTGYNYAYFPVICKSREQREALMDRLTKEGVFARRYFYPSLNKLPYLSAPVMLNSENVSDRVMCLPLYSDLADVDVDRMVEVIVEFDLNDKA